MNLKRFGHGVRGYVECGIVSPAPATTVPTTPIVYLTIDTEPQAGLRPSMPRLKDQETSEGQQKRKVRYNSVLTAAIETFAQRGEMQARIADIADRAGVAEGTIYEYFSSKTELFGSSRNAAWALLIQSLEHATSRATPKSLAAAVALTCQHHLRFRQKSPWVAHLLHQAPNATDSPANRAGYEQAIAASLVNFVDAALAARAARYLSALLFDLCATSAQTPTVTRAGEPTSATDERQEIDLELGRRDIENCILGWLEFPED